MPHPNSIVQAAEQAERAAGTFESAVHRLALMAEPGYGGNITALVELLSSDRIAEETRLRQEVATLRAERDAALVKLPACCGSLADAADTLLQDRDQAVAEAANALALMRTAEASAARSRAQFDNLTEEVSRAFRKHGLSAGPQAVDKLVDERDTFKSQRDELHARLYPQPCKGCPGCSSYADCPDEIQRLTKERDAFRQERDDLLAMRGEADDEAESERAALKAKIEALVEASRSAETILGNMAKETGRVFGRWEINHEPLRNDAQRMLPSFRAAIAEAKA